MPVRRAPARSPAPWRSGAPIWPMLLPPSTTRQPPTVAHDRAAGRAGRRRRAVSFLTYSGTRSTPCEWTPPQVGRRPASRPAARASSARHAAALEDGLHEVRAAPRPRRVARSRSRPGRLAGAATGDRADTTSPVRPLAVSAGSPARRFAGSPLRRPARLMPGWLVAEPRDAGPRHRLGQNRWICSMRRLRLVARPGPAHHRDLGRDPAEVALARAAAEPARPVDLALARVDELVPAGGGPPGCRPRTSQTWA